MMLHTVRKRETSLLSMVDLGEWADGSVLFLCQGCILSLQQEKGHNNDYLYSQHARHISCGIPWN